jgi:hypothetical protein
MSEQVVSLNFSEHAYAAFEGFMGSMPQVYLLRFDQPVKARQVRLMARELVSTQSRLRGVIEPGWWRYHLRILADDHIVHQLFDQAWRETPHIDARNEHALEVEHNRLLNQVLPLERGLGCRFQYIDHPQTPALFMTVHHLLADGRTMVHLLTQIMARLNGGPPMLPQAPEGPSLLGALTPPHIWQIPRQMWRSRGHVQRQSQWQRSLNVQQFQTPDQPVLSTHAVRYFTAAAPASALRPLARQLGLSVNSLVTLALAETFLSMGQGDPCAAAVIRLSVDLRRYYPEAACHGPLWGNHVGAFLVTETGRKTLQERADSIKAQVQEGLARFERREMLWTYLIYEVLPWLGRTAGSRLTMQMQRGLKLPRISTHATSIGNVSHLNPKGARIQLDLLMASVPSMAALHVLAEINDRIVMPLSWQRCEATVDQVDAYLAGLDRTLAALVDLGRRADKAA